jgi:hypothetical protein
LVEISDNVIKAGVSGQVVAKFDSLAVLDSSRKDISKIVQEFFIGQLSSRRSEFGLELKGPSSSIFIEVGLNIGGQILDSLRACRSTGIGCKENLIIVVSEVGDSIDNTAGGPRSDDKVGVLKSEPGGHGTSIASSNNNPLAIQWNIDNRIIAFHPSNEMGTVSKGLFNSKIG